MMATNGEKLDMSPTWKWVAGSLIGLIIAGMVFFLNSVISQMESMDAKLSKMSDTMTQIQIQLATTGASISAIERQVRRNEEAIIALERKQ